MIKLYKKKYNIKNVLEMLKEKLINLQRKKTIC